ncbi:hypothetical protein C8R43DRAFT_950618 [Mycena crocata]|nr:hypothetical protein C8R43DRAFT_950618 [Mycena crocata]
MTKPPTPPTLPEPSRLLLPDAGLRPPPRSAASAARLVHDGCVDGEMIEVGQTIHYLSPLAESQLPFGTEAPQRTSGAYTNVGGFTYPLFARLQKPVMSNEDDLRNFIVESVKYRIVDKVLGLEAINWPTRYRVKNANAVPPPFLPRSKHAEPPSVSYTSLAGTFENPACGQLDFCLFSGNTTTGVSCTTLSAEVAKFLPRVVDPSVPTLISKWETMVTNYVQMSHYSRNKFNLTGLQRNWTDYPCLLSSRPYFPTRLGVPSYPGVEVEFETDGEELGFELINMWGAGDVASPRGNTVRERAEQALFG